MWVGATKRVNQQWCRSIWQPFLLHFRLYTNSHYYHVYRVSSPRMSATGGQARVSIVRTCISSLWKLFLTSLWKFRSVALNVTALSKPARNMELYLRCYITTIFLFLTDSCETYWKASLTCSLIKVSRTQWQQRKRSLHIAAHGCSTRTITFLFSRRPQPALACNLLQSLFACRWGLREEYVSILCRPSTPLDYVLPMPKFSYSWKASFSCLSLELGLEFKAHQWRLSSFVMMPTSIYWFHDQQLSPKVHLSNPGKQVYTFCYWKYQRFLQLKLNLLSCKSQRRLQESLTEG